MYVEDYLCLSWFSLVLQLSECNVFNRPPYGANDIDQEEYDVGGRHRPQRNRDRSQNL